MTPSSWTPADLLELSGSYWATCALHAGVKLELFTPLATASHSAKELAAMRQADQRGLAMLLDALTAMGLLENRMTATWPIPLPPGIFPRIRTIIWDTSSCIITT